MAGAKRSLVFATDACKDGGCTQCRGYRLSVLGRCCATAASPSLGRAVPTRGFPDRTLLRSFRNTETEPRCTKVKPSHANASVVLSCTRRTGGEKRTMPSPSR